VSAISRFLPYFACAKVHAITVGDRTPKVILAGQSEQETQLLGGLWIEQSHVSGVLMIIAAIDSKDCGEYCGLPRLLIVVSRDEGCKTVALTKTAKCFQNECTDYGRCTDKPRWVEDDRRDRRQGRRRLVVC
jgi:hypothetical protein